MKKILLSLMAAAMLLVPCSSQASEQIGIYVAPKFVLNVQHAKGEMSLMGESASDSKTGARAGGALAIGYDFASQFNIPVRAELEYGAYGELSKTIDLGEGDSFKASAGFQTLLANVYWDVCEWNGFTPYVGAGLGAAFLKTEGKATSEGVTAAQSDDTDAVFAGQVGLGISYAFTDNISADLGYRFLMMDSGDTFFYNGTKLEAKDNYVHQFMLGLRVTF